MPDLRGRTTALDAGPDPRSPSSSGDLPVCHDPAALRVAWRKRALLAGWAQPQDWWCAEVDAVCEAAAERRDLVGPFTRLGHARAEAGVGIGETLVDGAELYAVLGELGPPFAVVRALAEAWVDIGLEPLRMATCEDPLTGLASAAHLRTRLAEVYREAERAGECVHSAYALVVVSTGLDGAVRWDGLLRRLALGGCLKSVFSGGETLASLGQSVVVGLVARTPMLGAVVESLRRRLAEVAMGVQVRGGAEARGGTAVREGTDGDGARGSGGTGVGVLGEGGPPRVWVEGLPGGLAEAYSVIDDLAR